MSSVSLLQITAVHTKSLVERCVIIVNVKKVTIPLLV